MLRLSGRAAALVATSTCVLTLAMAPAAGRAAVAPVAPSPATRASELRATGYDGAEIARLSAARDLGATLATPSAPAATGQVSYAEALEALRGGSGPSDTARALAALHRGTESEHDPRAALLLGLLYRSGTGVGRDDSLANRCFLLALHGGGCRSAIAHAQLAHAYFSGLGIGRDDSLAYRAAKDAYFSARGAECVDQFGPSDRWAAAEGMFFVAGESRMRGGPHGPDLPGAIFELEKGARNGDPACALRVATLFLPGARGDQGDATVQPDPARARDYLEMAQAAGMRGAAFPLAQLVAEGVGGARDAARARSLFESAADAGVPGARFELGARMMMGAGVARDSAGGLAQLRRAADEGSTPAMRALGGIAYGGAQAPRGGAARLAEAARWWERAAAIGDAASMHWLGIMHERGQHYPKSATAAADWYARAAAAGYVESR